MNAALIAAGKEPITGAEAGKKPREGVGKYGNKKVEVDGEWYDSMKEREFHVELMLREKCGRVRNIERQVYFLIVPYPNLIGYRADYTFDELVNGEWLPVVADVKGLPTEAYLIKRKLMKHLLGITIFEPYGRVKRKPKKRKEPTTTDGVSHAPPRRL